MKLSWVLNGLLWIANGFMWSNMHVTGMAVTSFTIAIGCSLFARKLDQWVL